jgi:ribosomal-protein-serine acetyltransferase
VTACGRAARPWRELPGGIGLRLLEPRDAEELHSLIEANREHLASWMPWAAEQTPADTVAFIDRTRRQLEGNDGFQLAIVRESRIVGVIGYLGVDWENRSTAIGYWLAAAEQGRGTMTEATRALLDHAFSAWALYRVEIRVGTGNERSRGIPRRLGFSEEGTLRQAERVGDRYVDLAVYSLLAKGRSRARRR